MKILFLSQGKHIEDHPGWHDALVQLKKEGEIDDFQNVPYLGYAEQFGWESFYKEVISLSRKNNYDLIYFHHFHGRGKPSPKPCLESLLNFNHRPIIITSCGDGFSDDWMRPDYPNDFKVMSSLADITFSTQMGKAADKIIQWGAKNVVFSPLGMCQVRFRPLSIDVERNNFEFDVVFLGSNNSNRLFNPISKAWWGSISRQKLVRELAKNRTIKFGLFGNYWKNFITQGPVSFGEQQETFQRGRILIDAPPYSWSDYYMSNRPIIQMASGVPTILYNVPRLRNIFRDNDHCYFVNDHYEASEILLELLSQDKKIIYNRAAETAKYIIQNHTQYHRMKFKIDTVKRYISNGNKLNVKFPFFLPEIDLKEETKYAIRTAL
jgi:hypothetical protein